MSKENKTQTVIQLIRDWKINQKMLSEKSGIAYSQFRLKISPNQKSYSFSEDELISIGCVISDIGRDINKLWRKK